MPYSRGRASVMICYVAIQLHGCLESIGDARKHSSHQESFHSKIVTSTLTLSEPT